MLFKQHLSLALFSVLGSVSASPIDLNPSLSTNPAHNLFRRVASNIACHDNHGAWGGDCVALINQYANDYTIQQPDSNGRAGVVYGSCLATVNYYSNSGLYSEYGGPIYSNRVLAQMAYEVYVKCFEGNEQIYKSGVGYTDRTNTGDGNAFKFCLCNNGSGGSC